MPAPNFNGPVDFTYTVTDGLTPVEAKVHVDVTPVNDLPLANDDRATATEDTPVTLKLLGNDTDPDGDTLTITEINGKPITVGTPVVITDAAGTPIGEVTVNPDGTVTFDPAPGLHRPGRVRLHRGRPQRRHRHRACDHRRGCGQRRARRRGRRWQHR